MPVKDQCADCFNILIILFAICETCWQVKSPICDCSVAAARLGKKKKRCPATDLISAVIRLTFDSHVRDLNIRFFFCFFLKCFSEITIDRLVSSEIKREGFGEDTLVRKTFFFPPLSFRYAFV